MDTFSALADPTRRHILELLSEYGELSATDISNRFEVSASAISQHLKVLRESNLVEMEKKAQQRLYRTNVQTMAEVDHWVQKTIRSWNGRLDKLEEIVLEEERTRNGLDS